MNEAREILQEVVTEFVEAQFQFHQGVSTKAAAEILQVHEKTIRNWVRVGKLKAYGIGAWKFKMADLLMFHYKNQSK